MRGGWMAFGICMHLSRGLKNNTRIFKSLSSCCIQFSGGIQWSLLVYIYHLHTRAISRVSLTQRTAFHFIHLILCRRRRSRPLLRLFPCTGTGTRSFVRRFAVQLMYVCVYTKYTFETQDILIVPE